MPLTTGARLGPYEIRSLLGSGGMGEVYLARDTKLDRDVALKLLPAGLAHDPDRLRRFEQEARSASALNHPAIVSIYDLGQDASQPYISMELVDGQTLRQILASGPMPTRRALQVAAQIADGLAKAHDAGIVHRDLKPENVMVSNDGFAKILDFGLAKLAARDAESVQTMTERGTRPGSVMGTVGYMSPEQASGRPADNRSDQFSFGLVFYEMLTGRRAFAQPTPVETLSAIIRDDPPPIGPLNPSVPAPVRWIVERCLAKTPADRYGSTRDLARDLATARDHLSELTGSGATPVATVLPRVKTRTRDVIAWSLVAAFALATIVLVVRRGGDGPADSGRPVRFTIAPPEKSTFVSDVRGSPLAVSPDGRRLVFVAARAEGKPSLWLRSFESLEARPLSGTDGAAGPFWSPDGLTVGFFAQSKLKRISLATGDVATVCEAQAGGGGGTWNRAGVILFAPGLDGGLYRVAAAGGAPTPVTTIDPAHEEASHLWPVFLPDGTHFVFRIMGRDDSGTYVGSLDSPEHKRVSAETSSLGFTLPDYLVFERDRTVMAQRMDLSRLELTGEPMRVAEGVEVIGPTAAFSASASGVLAYWSGGLDITQLTWVRRDGTVVGTVGQPAGYRHLALSPDGRQVAADRFDTPPSIWLLDVARGSATRVTFGAKFESSPVWSPDGQAIAFASARDSPPNVYLKRLGTSGEDERLFRDRLQSFPETWSPDGRFVAFDKIDPKTSDDIWVLPLFGDRKATPFLATSFAESYARISPDGRWMAYSSNESGKADVYVTRFPQPGGKWQVSSDGGSYPVWRHDGRELFYRARDGKLMAVPVGPGSEFDPGVAVPLFEPHAAISDVGAGTFYDVAPDGRFLVNVLVERTSPPVTVVLNWPTAIAGRQP